MKALFAALLQDTSVSRIQECFGRKQAQSFVYGLAGSQKHAVFAACYDRQPGTMVIVTHSHEALADWREDLTSLLPEVPVLELPETDLVNFSAAAKSVELSAKRMDVLGRLMRKEPVIVLARAAAAVQKPTAARLNRMVRSFTDVSFIFGCDALDRLSSPDPKPQAGR